MNNLHVTEIFESEAAKRFRLEYFPFFDLVDVRRSIITPSYNDLFYRNVRFHRIDKKRSGTGADQIIVYMPTDRDCVAAAKTGYVVIEDLKIREVVTDGEQ